MRHTTAYSSTRKTKLQLLWLIFWAMVAILSNFVGELKTQAAQSGPWFPPHHYPTDTSFHIGYKFNYLSSTANFISPRKAEKLPLGSTLSVLQHQVLGEFQPNRQLSLGVLLSIDTVKLTDKNAAFVSKRGLADQRIFAEYRFFDMPGRSAGAAIIAKFPGGYKNPTIDELNEGEVALLGDAQTDLTALLTTETWLNPQVRTRFDVGFTYRTEQYASEFPFLLSIGYVLPRFEFDLKFRGNASLNNDGFKSDVTDIEEVQTAFGSSQYALSKNPWTLIVEPTIEYWISPKFAAQAQFGTSLIGNSSPKFWGFGAGLTYRWAQTRVTQKRTFQDVSIETDQESGKFEGEKQSGKPEQRPSDADPIFEEPEDTSGAD